MTSTKEGSRELLIQEPKGKSKDHIHLPYNVSAVVVLNALLILSLHRPLSLLLSPSIFAGIITPR